MNTAVCDGRDTDAASVGRRSDPGEAFAVPLDRAVAPPAVSRRRLPVAHPSPGRPLLGYLNLSTRDLKSAWVCHGPCFVA